LFFSAAGSANGNLRTLALARSRARVCVVQSGAPIRLPPTLKNKNKQKQQHKTQTINNNSKTKT
jgi:hypothetical protein